VLCFRHGRHSRGLNLECDKLGKTHLSATPSGARIWVRGGMLAEWMYSPLAKKFQIKFPKISHLSVISLVKSICSQLTFAPRWSLAIRISQESMGAFQPRPLSLPLCRRESRAIQIKECREGIMLNRRASNICRSSSISLIA
jgi:hypothetical protein